MDHSHSSTQPSSSSSTSTSQSSSSSVVKAIGAVLPQSILSTESSVLSRLSARPSASSNSRLQLTLHPHSHFLNRSDENCPSHLTGKQRTNWLKAGGKAQANQHLLINTPRFTWPQHSYGDPIFLNYLTTESTLQTAIHDISLVSLFSIDTESCASQLGRPPIPALIQIEAIHNIHSSIIFLLETQHLPHPASTMFHLFQTFCRHVFSPSNKIISWGNPRTELQSFDCFNLFRSSTIQYPINLQTTFAEQWNRTHPHHSSCPMSSLHSTDILSANELICLVDTQDLDFNSEVPSHEPDSSLCSCPTEIRPYKTDNPLWSLQKAIYYTFNEALDKEITLSLWSCGLDHHLHPFSSLHDYTTRQAMITYAINDVLGPTRLYFHLFSSEVPQSIAPLVVITNTDLPFSTDLTLSTDLPFSSRSVSHSITTTISTMYSISNVHHANVLSKPLIYILTDSHGKFLSQHLSISTYQVQVNAIPGLRFLDPYSPHLCATTILQSPEVSSILSMAAGLILLIGTNSARSIPFTQMIQQVSDLISLLRHQQPHLSSTQSITIISTFPCFKPSNAFPTQSLLSNNIPSFNTQLFSLSNNLNFSFLDLNITAESLSFDKMHIHPRYHHLLLDRISTYINHLSFTSAPDLTTTIHTTIPTTNTDTTNTTPDLHTRVDDESSSSTSSPDDQHNPASPPHNIRPSNRSAASKQQRNRRRHAIRHIRRQQHILSRPIYSLWTLTQLKAFIRSFQIRFAFLSPIRHLTLRIAFNNEIDLTVAAQVLPADIFDENHYNAWLSQQQHSQ